MLDIMDRVIWNEMSMCYIKNSTHDAYNPKSETANNLLISSWYGISFPTYDGTSKIGFNTRNGDAYFEGELSMNSISALGLISAKSCILDSRKKPLPLK